MNDHVMHSLMRSSLAVFVRQVFATLDPGTFYQHNWHIDAICHALERVMRRECRRLIITLPPRSLKSRIVSVAFPAFLLGHDPTRKVICASYNQDLATSLHNECRQIMKSDFFIALFGAAGISPMRDTGAELILAGNGSRFATSTEGTLTGRGADILIIDDPLKAQDAHSETRRGGVNSWLTGTAMSRLNDKKTGAVILVMQRLHENDPVGHMLARGGDAWEVLDLPAIAPCDRIIRTGWGSEYEWRAGEALHPGREPLEVLEQLRKDLGSEAFSAQYLQAPVPPGGNIIKREWLKSFESWPDENESLTLQCWDTASKTGTENDYSVCITAMISNGQVRVVDVVREKLDYPALRARAIGLAERYRPWKVLIEDTGVGTGLIGDLKRKGINAIGVMPKGSKEDRARVHSAKFEAGRVLFPPNASWLDILKSELLAFPNGRHDDQVDALMYILEASDEPQPSVEFWSFSPRRRRAEAKGEKLPPFKPEFRDGCQVTFPKPGQELYHEKQEPKPLGVGPPPWRPDPNGSLYIHPVKKEPGTEET